MRTRFHLALSLCLGLAAGCTLSAEEDAVQIGESSARIVGGTPTTEYPAVALLYSEFAETDGAQLCSGTLISPRVILTAAHCVEFPDGPPNQYLAYFGSNVLVDPDPEGIATINIIDYQAHPNWNINDLDAGHDIGLVLLEEEAPPQVQPMRLNRGPIDQRVGEQVHLVGWGRTSGEGDDFGVKREVMSALQGADALLMQYGSPTANTCQGDSGGPNFMTVDGVEVVAGITSFGNEGCDQYGVGTRVDTFAQTYVDPYVVKNDPNGFIPGEGSDPSGDDQGAGTDAEPEAGGVEPVSGGCSAGGGASELLGLVILLAVLLGLRLSRARLATVRR